MLLSVSYLSSYYSKEKTIEKIESTSADMIHVDLMDGGFVPKKNFTIESVTDLLRTHKKPLDIHLMTFDPMIYIDDLKELKPEYITFHIEATKDIVSTIESIKKNNIKVGISLKPNTDLLELMPYLSLVDLVLIMSVTPGKGGQDFLFDSVFRINELLRIRKENNLNFKISVDGGINSESIKLIEGIDIVVSGSYICKSNDYEEKIQELKQNMVDVL